MGTAGSTATAEPRPPTTEPAMPRPPSRSQRSATTVSSARVRRRYRDEQTDRQPRRLEQLEVDPFGVHDRRAHHDRRTGRHGRDLEPAWAEQQSTHDGIHAGPGDPKATATSSRLRVSRRVNCPIRNPSSLMTPVASGFNRASSIMASRPPTPPTSSPSSAPAAVMTASRRADCAADVPQPVWSTAVVATGRILSGTSHPIMAFRGQCRMMCGWISYAD
jgi:hypothetical protein